MKGHYELTHLQQLANAIPLVIKTKVIKKYTKIGEHLTKKEREMIVKDHGRVDKKLPYHFVEEKPIYVNHLDNLRKLNKQKDAKDQIERYTLGMRDKALQAINQKISTK